MAASPGAAYRAGQQLPRIRQTLGQRIVVITLIFCGIFTVGAVTVRTYFAWSENYRVMQMEMQLIDQVFQASLAKAVWEMDEHSINTQIESVALASSLGRVQLKIIRPGQAPILLDHRSPDYVQAAAAPILSHSLKVFPYEGTSETVGELTIEGNEEALWSRLWEEISSIILTQMLQSLALAILITVVFNRSVTSHVRKIALHLANISSNTLHHRLDLDRSAAVEDELTLLKSGVNDLQDKLAAYLVRQRADEQAMTDSNARLAETVKERTRELEQLNLRLEEMSRKDPLTGLANRRQFEETKNIEFTLARERCAYMAVLMCDVDFFKLYNDTLGHAAGDECLKAVARIIQNVVDCKGHLAARYGGEEFAVLMPGITVVQAEVIAGKIRSLLGVRKIPHPSSPICEFVTMSMGVAELKHNQSATFDELLKCADDALYRAKRSGRDRISL